MNTRKIIHKKELLDKRNELIKELDESINIKNQMDGKMQSRYDTQKEEWAFRCELISRQLLITDQVISSLEDFHNIKDLSRVVPGVL